MQQAEKDTLNPLCENVAPVFLMLICLSLIPMCLKKIPLTTLILSEIAPNQQDQILQRGMDYGRSRNICNVHWHSDVQAGQIIGAATVAQLHANPVFRADLRAARKEVKAQQTANNIASSISCKREQAALQP